MEYTYTMLVLIIAMICVYYYLYNVKKTHKHHASCKDILNKRLLYNICCWDLLHIAFFTLCVQ